jgi:hypothetical protein
MKESLLFRGETSVSKIAKKRDGVNRVNPVFVICQTCRHAIQSCRFDEPVSMKTG